MRSLTGQSNGYSTTQVDHELPFAETASRQGVERASDSLHRWDAEQVKAEAGCLKAPAGAPSAGQTCGHDGLRGGA